MTDTMISASDTSLVATTICFPVPERTLGAVPAGVFVTPIHQQLTVRRKFHDLLPVDDQASARRFSFEKRRRSRHFDRFLH